MIKPQSIQRKWERTKFIEPGKAVSKERRKEESRTEKEESRTVSILTAIKKNMLAIRERRKKIEFREIQLDEWHTRLQQFALTKICMHYLSLLGKYLPGRRKRGSLSFCFVLFFISRIKSRYKLNVDWIRSQIVSDQLPQDTVPKQNWFYSKAIFQRTLKTEIP